MIDFIKQSPPVYSKESRDYQLISRLLTALLSYSESYSNNMSVYNDTINPKLSELRALTLNFIPKHQWPTETLNAVTSCFKYLIQSKGSIDAIRTCFYIILRFENIESDVDIKIEGKKLHIEIAENIEKVGAIKDLLEYIVPAGVDYEISIVKPLKNNLTGFVYSDSANTSQIPDTKVTIYSGTSDTHIGYIYFNEIHKNNVKKSSNEVNSSEQNTNK